MMQAAPFAFQLLEIFMMQNQIDLFGKFSVDLCNNRFDGLISVV